MPAHGHMLRPVVTLTPTTQSGYNIKTAAGSPAAGTDVLVVVQSGVVLSGSVRTGTPWNADCSITIVVQSGGIIGGAGQDGANAVANAAGLQPTGTGGHGIFIEANVKTFIRIQTPGTGFIAGGGGAGASGASNNSTGSGPGGGGQGYPGGAAGARVATFGTSATAGTNSAPGLGGSGASPGDTSRTGRGSDGAGLAGIALPGEATTLHAGGAGGLPGSAIYSTGFPAPTILEGNDSAHIKGAITT